MDRRQTLSGAAHNDVRVGNHSPRRYVMTCHEALGEVLAIDQFPLAEWAITVNARGAQCRLDFSNTADERSEFARLKTSRMIRPLHRPVKGDVALNNLRPQRNRPECDRDTTLMTRVSDLWMDITERFHEAKIYIMKCCGIGALAVQECEFGILLLEEPNDRVDLREA